MFTSVTKLLKKISFWALPIGYLVLSAKAQAEEKTFQDPKVQLQGRYSFTAPASGSKRGLLVFFHGSGGAASYAQNYAQISSIADRWQLQVLSLQTPGMALSWAEDGAGGKKFATYVKDLLDEAIFRPYPQLDRKRTAFVGVSAGSTFVMGDFLPQFGSEFAGGAVFLCGGGFPMLAGRPNIGQMSQNFRMHAIIQAGDFLFMQTQGGLAFWQSQGLKASLETLPGTGHCNFDFAAALERGLREIMPK